LTDKVTSTSHHWVFDRWVEEHLKKQYMAFTPDGRMQTMGLYYDPQIDHLQSPNPIMGIAPCWYVLPQDRPLAELMYQTAVTTLGWNNPAIPVTKMPDPRFLAMGLVLALEFGDTVTTENIRRSSDEWSEPRFFENNDEFGFWFQFGEDYPRGQLSSFLLLGELVEGGSWWRVFNEPNLAKFDEPVVVGVDYPKIGLSEAQNDDDGVLHANTYVATASHRGQATSFRVENLPAASRASVRRDGAPYDRWKATGPNTIEIDTDIERREFEIITGYRRNGGSQATGDESASVGKSRKTTVLESDASALGASAVKDAGLLLVSGGGTCPCCV
jgi:hypothetical protein